jgi:FkbM family methyltransferase
MRQKNFIKKILRTISIDIRNYSARNIFDQRIVHFLSDLDCDLVVDVGANRGQFGKTLFGHGFKGKLISFEPIPEAHALLSIAAQSESPNWIVAAPMAITDGCGTANLTIAQNSASSSLLGFTDKMKDLVPVARAVDEITVPTNRLDQALSDLGYGGRRIALKIDTQGSEMAVLIGSEGVFDKIAMIMLEASISQMYQDQPSYFEIDLFLRERGWQLFDIEPGYRNPKNLALCEFDAIYVRKA